MPDLSTIQGASLQPRGGEAFKALQEGIQTFRTRGLAETLAGTPSPEQEKQALVQLSTVNPEVARTVQGVLNRNNALEQQALGREIRKGVELAARLTGKDFNGKRRLLMEEAQTTIANNGDPSRLMELLGKSEDELSTEIQRMQIAGTATQTLLEKPAKLAALKAQQDASLASFLKSIPQEQRATAFPELMFKAQQENDTDTVNLIAQLRQLPPQQQDIVLDDTIRRVPRAKPISLAKGARLVDPVTREVLFQPAEPLAGGVDFAKPAVKDFTPASVEKAESSGGSVSDLVVRPEVLAKLKNDGDRFVTGFGQVVNKGGKLFFATPIQERNKEGEVVQRTLLTPIGGKEGKPAKIVSRALGETRAEQILGEAKEAGLVTLAQQKALIKTRGDLTAEGKRVEADFISMTAAVDAAENIPQLKRNLELLQTIETGGIDAIVLATARTLGVESGDQAELTFNLRTNVLKQLKPTFGAQFTEREGKLLAEIQASETKSTAGNIRLMKRAIEIYNKAINRGLRAAKRRGDIGQTFIEDIEAGRAPLRPLGEGVETPAPTIVPQPGGLTAEQKSRLEQLRKKQR